MKANIISRKVNQLGDVLAQIKALEQEAGALKAELKDAGVTEFETANYKLAIFPQSRGSLDKNAVVDRLGLAWVAEHTIISESTVVKVTPVAKAGA